MMDQWSNRYANGRGGVRAADHALADRVRNIALILLTVALLGVGIAGGQAIAFRAGCRTTFINRMQTECSSALSQANTLSRSGGADSSAMLGKIRANIHAVDTVNAMSNTLYGSYVVSTSTFADMYAIIDSYSNKLKNGVTTIEEQTNLVNSLTALQSLLSESK
ncbi:MAG: hypothetical protein IJZ74_05545 [Clostridia bacterium]|nr:hypothetical protein [Clostridia bacterium]